MRAAQLIQGRVIDETAQTCREIHAEHPYYSLIRVRELVRESVEAGRLEPVWKSVRGKITQAYRPKKGEKRGAKANTGI